jgi:HK97 family phage prohead protease
VSQKLEKRTLSVELRAEPDFVIAGYAALFDSPSKNLGGFTEVIAPTAFTRSLAEKAVVRFTFNHSLDDVLARTDSGSLELSTDSKGLKFRAQLNKKIQRHADIWEACRSKLYDECSFAFTVPDGGDAWSPDGRRRTLLDVDLMDCAIVGVPAYEGTSATARNNNSDAAFVEAARARLAAMNTDFERSERAHEIKMRILSEGRADDNVDDSDEDDVFEKACRTLGLDFCDSDDDFVFASDPNDLNEENCLRFSYEIDGEGNVILDESTRTKVRHELLHSERGRKILFFKRIKRSAGVR